ncbi:hypothetical protein D9757_008767 [Collybiopsis confluens]|uniref:Uncharacterized protein n=1 Tax=Collybiopsis confluens TaxID=2823264 RepID=A0A8H5H5E2_9AGAR|nr:hypothetical protein D9757_008767 [Collybiopsis confluens]
MFLEHTLGTSPAQNKRSFSNQSVKNSPPNRPVLRPGANKKSFKLDPAPLGTPINGVCSSPADYLHKEHPECPHETWIRLELDDSNWTSFNKFTLRISWPGSSPADFHINILNPESTATRFTGEPAKPPEPALTRVKYARIRVVDTGVISPLSGLTKIPPVPFIVTLEPLYLGLIPATVVPFLLVLIPAIVVSLMAAPYIYKYLREIARAAKSEMQGKEKKA